MIKRAKKIKNQEFVLDCSVALAWCFPDERAPYPQGVLDSLASAYAVVPSLWLLEIGNALLVGERRKRSTQAETAKWLEFLNLLPINIEEAIATYAWGNVLGLARAHNLSTYDAAYLELALRRGLTLATLDDKLRGTALALGVSEYELP
jgi:predicted nucleic acid-binding protein